MRVVSAVLLLAFGVLASGNVQAADRHVEIVNKTGRVMTHFYASNSGRDSWEEDILGRSTLDDNDSVVVDINDGTGACKFDFKAVFQGGSTSVRENINVCEIETFTYRP